MTLGWAVVCCVVQPNATANLIYLVVFALNIYACLYVAPGLLLPYLGQRSLFIYGIFLCIPNLLNLVFAFGDAGAFVGGRLRGFLIDPLHTGMVAWITSILILWAILQGGAKRRYLWVAWSIAMCVLVMTRTRSYIFGCTIGSLALVATAARPHNRSTRHARQLALGLLPIVIILGGIIGYNPHILPRVRTHLRLEGDAEDILKARMTLWEWGIQHSKTYPVFGRGPMAKFGDTTDPSVNAYETRFCFSNTWLTMAQSYGIPGSALYAASVLAMLVMAFRGYGTMPTLAIGLLVAGIGSSFSSMWSVSFGSAGDRAMWLILGLALAAPPFTKRHPLKQGGFHQY